MRVIAKELFRYRMLLKYLVVSELKQRYRGSVLGFLWTLLNPLLLMLVMWAIFSRVRRFDQEHYTLFLLAGLMAWLFFSQSVEQALNTIIGRASLFKNGYIPKIIFPTAVVTSKLVNLMFFCAAYILISLFAGRALPATNLLLPLAVFNLFLYALGTTLITCSLNVFFRDITHLTTAILRALFYLTPVFYKPEMLGPEAAYYLRFNPLYYPVTCIRSVIYDGQIPSLMHWGISFGIGFGLVTIGLLIFTKCESKFVYYT